MGCGCGGGSRQTVTTSDVQQTLDAGGYKVVNSSTGETIYEGNDYLAALRARNSDRSVNQLMGT